MARRRFIQQPDGSLQEVSRDYVANPRQASDTGILWNDRSYQDLGDPRFTSRTQHREYMKQNGLTTVDDYTETFKQAEKERVAVKHGHDPRRKQAVIEAFQRLSK